MSGSVVETKFGIGETFPSEKEGIIKTMAIQIDIYPDKPIKIFYQCQKITHQGKVARTRFSEEELEKIANA